MSTVTGFFEANGLRYQVCETEHFFQAESQVEAARGYLESLGIVPAFAGVTDRAIPTHGSWSELLPSALPDVLAQVH